MSRTSTLRAALLAAALAILPAAWSTVFGESTQVTTIVERRTEANADSPQLAEVYQSVLLFEPGTWTPPHTHSGGSYNTVISGVVTLRIGETEYTYGPGEGWTDVPDLLHVAGNSSDEPAQLIASMVVERGMPPSTIVEVEDEAALPPFPDVQAFTKGLAGLPAGPLDVVEQALTLEPNAEVTLPAPLGPRMVGVLDGTLTVVIDGESHTFEAGDGWTEPAGATYLYTTGETGARLATTTLTPRAELASNAGE